MFPFQGLTCNDITCSTGRICGLDERNQPTCVCNTVCYYYYYPVCGNDGKTYYNDCYLQMEACTTDKNIKMDYYGSCTNGNTTFLLLFAPFMYFISELNLY